MALSMILLSLGAPFWYDALKDLVGPRPVLARKEQVHGERRQAAAGPAVPPALAEEAGEKGDLNRRSRLIPCNRSGSDVHLQTSVRAAMDMNRASSSSTSSWVRSKAPA